MSWPGLPRIIPYIGYANENFTFITGEVTESYSISKPVEGQSKWRNMKAMLKRYAGNDIEGARVKITYRGKSREEITDKYGIFRCYLEHPEGQAFDGIWQTAKVELLSPIHRRNPFRETEAEIMLLNGQPDYGVISDIDDTILISYATQKLVKLRLMLVNNALTRMPFEGVSAFYQALQQGVEGNRFNPIFYVSNSEWNLYDLLYEFIAFHRIPKGPLFLREMKLKLFKSETLRQIRKNHKREVISRLFATFPDMKFILIGDSGQRDPDVYSETVKLYPGRVLCIYIRDVGIPENTAQVETISQHLNDKHKVEMVLVKDTEAAARHAIANGFISPDFLQTIKLEKKKDLRVSDEL